MSFYLSPRSMPSSPRSKSPPKKVSPYTPNSPKARKSDIFVFPTTDLDLNPNSPLELGNKSVANSLYNFSVGIETRLPIILKQIIDFRNCVPLENHVFEKFVSLIDSAAACPSDCQYILLTIPVEMILYKSLIPSKYVLTQLIERAERLLSPDNFFVTYKSHQIIPRYHIQEMIRLFRLLLGEETLNPEDFLKDGKVVNSKFIELLARSGSIDELALQDEENYLRSTLPNILEYELEQLRLKKEREEREIEEKQRAALEKQEEIDREIRAKQEQERIRKQQEDRAKQVEAMDRANRLRVLKQKAAKRKAEQEKAEKLKEEQERQEQERIKREKEEREEKEKREREARMMAIRKMAARKKAQLERAEKQKEIRLRLEKEARERKEREERERKAYAREAVLQVSRNRIQTAKDKKEKAQLERERLLQIAKEKEAKEREELNIDKPYDLKRANSLQVRDIKRLLNPEEFEENPDQKHLRTPRPLKGKGKSEGRFYLTENEKKKRANSLTPTKIANDSDANEIANTSNNDNISDDFNENVVINADVEGSGFHTPDKTKRRNLELSPVDEKETMYYKDDITLSLSPTQESENTKEYQSKSIQKFLSEELSIKERIKIGNQMSQDLNSQEREKINRYAKLFMSWETAYHAVKQVWMVMKKDDKFDINILLSMMPVTFADYTVTGLKTFANDEGITIADIENCGYDKLL